MHIRRGEIRDVLMPVIMYELGGGSRSFISFIVHSSLQKKIISILEYFSHLIAKVINDLLSLIRRKNNHGLVALRKLQIPAKLY
jgi:hypothetical protein